MNPPTCLILGGGAAGIFAALRCKEVAPDASVIILEKSNTLLAKVRISGGGRCNVTHACFDPKELTTHYPRGGKELLGPFHHFQPRDTIRWFEERGVPLKVEEDGRMFPTTDSSETILHCLLSECEKQGVEIRKQQKVLSVEKRGPLFHLILEKGELTADRLLLATGSAPAGHEIAQRLGHTLIEPVPSLFTFNVPSSPLLDLSGISVPSALLTLEGTPFSQRGPLLLTHWGFSGPAALKLSAWAARALHALSYRATLTINWTQVPHAEKLFASLLEEKGTKPHGPLPPLLPSNLLARLCLPLEIDPTEKLQKLSHKALLALAQKLTCDRYQIEGKTTYKQEFVTAGGVELKGIHFKTMESKHTPGLFFAGEVLDIDGVTGGFNFQNAWTTGWIAGSRMGRVS